MNSKHWPLDGLCCCAKRTGSVHQPDFYLVSDEHLEASKVCPFCVYVHTGRLMLEELTEPSTPTSTMPRSRSSNLSEETLDALLEALGLSPVVHEDLKNAAPISRMDVSYVDITQDPSHDHRPKTPFSQIEEVSLDEARLFGQNYLSDFDISSEFDEDSSDCDIGEYSFFSLLE